MLSVKLGESACTKNEWLVAREQAEFEPGTYRMRGGRSIQ